MHRQALRSFGLCLLLAVAVCLLRVAIFDWRFVLSTEGIAPHDQFSSVPIFASSMHSMFLSGEIAWWLTTDHAGGYAQYYNHFLSPMAPTAGHMPYVLWGGIIHLLSLVGIHLAEYPQYLFFNQILAPVLCYLALALLTRRMVRTWTATALCVLAYALGGTGLWNNSWMFYQEWFCLFLFLFALDLYVRDGSWKAQAILALAVVNWTTSINYWTVFSSWFVLTFIGLHTYVFWRNWVTIYRAIRRNGIARRSQSLIAVTTLFCFAWAFLIGSVYLEQRGVLARGSLEGGGFSSVEAWKTAGERSDIARGTAQLLVPSIDSLKAYQVHSAKYVSLLIGVLAIAGLFVRRGRYTPILLGTGAMVVLVLIGGGIFRTIYDIWPGLAMVRHVFFFYSYFLQIIMILFGTYVLDRLLRFPPRIPRALMWTTAALAATGLALLIWHALTTEITATSIEATMSLFGIMLAVSAGAVAYAASGRSRTLAAGLVLLIAAADLSRYYIDVSAQDQADSKVRMHASVFNGSSGTVPEAAALALARPWSAPADPQMISLDGLSLMPLQTALWPTNGFNPAQNYTTFHQKVTTTEEYNRLTPPYAVAFGDEISETPDGPQINIQNHAGFGFSRQGWQYNDLTFSVSVPSEGYVISRLSYDPYWTASVDGVDVDPLEVNYRMLAIPISEGEHVLRLSYQPMARRLYGPLKLATVLFCLALVIILWQGRRRSPHLQTVSEPAILPLL